MRRLAIIPFLLCVFIFITGFDGFKTGDGFDVSDGFKIPSTGMSAYGTVSYDTVTFLIAAVKTIDANTAGAWDAADHIHDDWPAAAPDSLYVDTVGQYIRYVDTYRGVPDDPDLTSIIVLSNTDFGTRPEVDHPHATAERTMMQWADLSFLPEGATLISLEACWIVYTDILGGGWLSAFVDTTAADTAWVSTTLGAPWSYNMRSVLANWNDLDDPNSTAWSPAFGDRTTFANLGIEGPRVDMTGTVSDGASLTFQLVDGVTHALGNDVYAGWTIKGETSAQRVKLTRHNVASNTLTNEQPFIKGTYTTANYESPFPGGAKYAFIFTTDDGHGDNLEFYEPCFSDRGKRYQAYLMNEQASGAYMDDAEILTLYQTGTVDIGTHTANHWWITDDGFHFGHVLDADSLMSQLHTSWLADKIGVDSTAIKTVAYPSCSWGDPTVQFIIDNLPQLKGGRSCQTNSGHYPTWYADVDTNVVDGGIWGVDVRSHWPTHLLSSYTQNEVETKADSLKATMGIGDMWVILSHHVAEADTQHVGWLLDHLIADGDWWICTYDEYIDRYRSLHDMTDQWLPEWNW